MIAKSDAASIFRDTRGSRSIEISVPGAFTAVGFSGQQKNPEASAAERGRPSLLKIIDEDQRERHDHNNRSGRSTHLKEKSVQTSGAIPIYGYGGEVAFQAHLFISAMGASGCAYAEATRTESLPDWLGSHVRALEFYGAAPTIIVPDNLKVGVTRADRYEPDLQRSYEEMAGHYHCVVIPARPYRPKDKSRVELSVLLTYRWILARLRHQRFLSLDDLNAARAYP